MESSVIGEEKWGDVRLDEKLSEQAGGEAGERGRMSGRRRSEVALVCFGLSGCPVFSPLS